MYPCFTGSFNAYQYVPTKDGGEIKLHADTICVHGDNPEAVALVKNVREGLIASKIDIAHMGTFL